ncbi:uncharacterized protein LOC100881262 isoform X2 [Megachile rotundata]|uniref:uncharacterized protein LOC100881262 isoform X2 n=1 Tax=Megachile rotundata TaxID=143995 RepID=UPI000258D487
MEKEIDRINRRVELKESTNEKELQQDKQFKGTEIRKKEMKGEGDRRDEEVSTPRTNAMLGLCAICHLTLGNINSNLNHNIPCSQRHALCQRCIQHFTIQLDPGCILCHAQYQQSNINLSQESNISLNSMKSHSKRSQAIWYQSEYQPRHHQQVQQYIPINTEQSYASPWNQNYSSAASNIEKNSLEHYNNDSETSFDYERSKEQNNAQKERNKDVAKRNQQYSQYNLFEKGNVDSYTSEARVNGQITFECSRRPIRCPRIDCAINVAFSALTHHFIFDHPEVPILSVEPGIKSTLVVSFSALSPDSSRCLALLLVSGKLSDPVARLFNGNQMNPKFRNRLPLSVLAARLHCRNQCTSVDKINKDFHEKDVIIAWVAGLDIGNTKQKLICSIQAIDKIDTEGLRSLTYTGPINSLRTAQCPEDIFSTGDCIVLHEGLLGHITSDCATLNVNVTVH